MSRSFIEGRVTANQLVDAVVEYAKHELHHKEYSIEEIRREISMQTDESICSSMDWAKYALILLTAGCLKSAPVDETWTLDGTKTWANKNVKFQELCKRCDSSLICTEKQAYDPKCTDNSPLAISICKALDEDIYEPEIKETCCCCCKFYRLKMSKITGSSYYDFQEDEVFDRQTYYEAINRTMVGSDEAINNAMDSDPSQYDIIPELTRSVIDLGMGCKKLGINTGDNSPQVAVVFPTVVVKNERIVGRELWFAVKGDFRPYLPDTSLDDVCQTSNGHNIFGLTNTYLGHFSTTSDYTLLPISSYVSKYAYIPDTSPRLMGTSCLAAIAVCDRATYKGLKPVAITGNVRPLKGSLCVAPNPAVDLKKSFLDGIGLQLIHSDIEKDPLPLDVAVAKMGIPEERDFKVKPIDPRSPSCEGLCSAMDTDMLEWVQLSTKISSVNEEFSKLMDLVNYIEANGLIDVLHDYTELDRDGSKLYKHLAINTGKMASAGGPDPFANQALKAQKLYENLKGQYPGITPEWIIANGYRGPVDAAQARSFQAKKLSTSDATVIVQKIVASLNMAKNLPPVSQEAQARLLEYVLTNGKGPNPDLMQEIVGERKKAGGDASLVSRIAAANGIKPDTPIYEKLADLIAQKGKGPSEAELKAINQMKPKASNVLAVQRDISKLGALFGGVSLTGRSKAPVPYAAGSGKPETQRILNEISYPVDVLTGTSLSRLRQSLAEGGSLQ